MGAAPWFVLLRGINVGGHRSVPMAELRAGLDDVGFARVQTYIQSGNIVLGGGPGGRAEVEQAVIDVLSSRFGLDDVIVIALSRDRLERARRASERAFPDDGADPTGHAKRTHVVFLDAAPEPSRRASLDPDAFGADRFVLDVRGDDAEVHIAYATGAGTSKLTTDRIERSLGVRATARNLNTLDRLLAMAE